MLFWDDKVLRGCIDLPWIVLPCLVKVNSSEVLEASSFIRISGNILYGFRQYANKCTLDNYFLLRVITLHIALVEQ